MAKRFQRLRVDTAFYRRQQHLIRLGNFARNDDFLRVKQVDGNGDSFTQVATNVLNDFCCQIIAFICCLTDGFDAAIIQRESTWITLLQ